MAELNPNIILGVKPVEMPNLLDQASKAMTMGNLAQEHQLNQIHLNEVQRQASDMQTMRDAFKNNTKVDESGNPVTDRRGVMRDLTQANPLLANKQMLDWRQQDLDKITQQHALGKQLIFSVPVGNDATPDQKQAAWSDALQKAQQFGLPGMDKQPQQYPGDSYVRNLQMRSLSAEEQIQQANKSQELSIQQQKAQVELAREQREASQFGYGKRMEANQQVQSSLESARQSDDAKKALNDIYASKKVDSLVAQAGGDPNKLDMTKVKLLSSEVAKIAQGGAPTESELHGLTPKAVPQWLSDVASRVQNKPTPANAGAFVTSLQKYANSVAGDAKELLSARGNRIVEEKKDYLSPTDYQKFKSNVANEFSDPEKSYGNSKSAKETQKTIGSHPQDSAAVSWAKANPKDPRAIKILQLNGAAANTAQK